MRKKWKGDVDFRWKHWKSNQIEQWPPTQDKLEYPLQDFLLTLINNGDKTIEDASSNGDKNLGESNVRTDVK
ncbi:hypothetical protein CRM22_003598, partial [Opisthorchis felineus]